MALTKYELSLAVKINNSYKAQHADYLASCESYRAEGYRPATCEHGTSLWTDWDNICGPCEDGITLSDPRFRMGLAIDQAKGRVAKVHKITEHLAALRELGVTFTPEQMKPVWDKINDLLTVE